MGRHLGFLKTSSMLRNHLSKREVAPEECTFKLVAHGPNLEEADGMEEDKIRRDVIGALERARR